jgi:hypothetical protein
MTQFRTSLVILAAAFTVLSWRAVPLSAHDVVYEGTIVAATATHVEVHVVDATTKRASDITFGLNDRTKIQRGTHRVTLSAAAMRTGERIAVIVNHDLEKAMVASEVRLPKS